MLSEQKHLRKSLNQCGYKNSIIDHAISFNRRHNTKTATSIQKNKRYVTLPYYGELSDKMKHYDISTLFIPVNTLNNFLVHPKDKQKKAVKVMLCMKFVTTQTLLVKMHILVRHLKHHLRQHCRSSYNGNDSAVFKHIIASGHQIDVNDITILDKEDDWFERCVKETV